MQLLYKLLLLIKIIALLTPTLELQIFCCNLVFYLVYILFY